ncbi:MAG: flagellar motor switch protein FliG [Candidatus Krumholzibacteria bacterium]|jgi:flagellar motor switch protein FliG|nr:flagellar motor switch protein FliG [Candidatus Krumholzibacteria bacterium]MDP6670010.1 flagellar motor switch protein FliG [Candidatus Krumholzibacteria bacterium]MDP6796622.1 flagellar motor switch protein FliG [Candidatus Krumholzibacteria bacterium]MDP7020956.1 flagellar motor switch protein FliG [Candidatus Krumholzibacteria bacterium]
MNGTQTSQQTQSRTSRTGLNQAAKLLVSLGPEAASLITKHLNESELEAVSNEILNLGPVTAEEKKRVISRFYETATERRFISQGGEEYARRILSATLGDRRAGALIDRFQEGGENNFFGQINSVDPPTVANFLKKEHPQTIALVLSSLPSRQAGQILVNLPDEIKSLVAYRMATIERPSSEVISEIQSVLGDYVNTDFQDLGIKFGGTSQVAETFNEIEQNVWRDILDEIGEIDSDVAEEIKNQMFTFGDLILLDNKSVQSLLKEVDSKDLTLALKGASEEVRELLFRNMSRRAGETIREEMEYMGAVRVSEVENAQQRIIDTVRDLEAEGLIYIEGRGGEESAFIE